MLWPHDVHHTMAAIAFHLDGDIRHASWHPSQQEDGRHNGDVQGRPQDLACRNELTLWLMSIAHSTGMQTIDAAKIPTAYHIPPPEMLHDEDGELR